MSMKWGKAHGLFDLVTYWIRSDSIRFDLMNACGVRVECRHKDTVLSFQQQLLISFTSERNPTRVTVVVN